jgi:hypothetical protein
MHLPSSFAGEFLVTSVSSDRLNVAQTIPVVSIPPYCDGYFNSVSTSLNVIANTLGGNLRVSNITVTDETGNQFKTRYGYSKDVNGRTLSSGVISKDPDFARNVPKSQLDELFDYPTTPVIYGKVTVWNGRLSNDGDYNDKTEYSFVTPNSSMVTLTSNMESTPLVVNQQLSAFLNTQNIIEALNARERLVAQNNYVQINTNRIGQVQSIKKYNRWGVVEQSTDFGYSSDAHSTNSRKQGVYSEGVLTSDLVQSSQPQTFFDYNFIINRTSKKYLPSVLTSVTTTSNNLTTVTRNTGFDFYTGEVLEKEYENALGAKFRSVQVPAYTLGPYAGMGSKVDNPANKHMLTQTAASYLYKLDAAGNPVGTVAAAIQTWKNDWGTYRSYNGTAYANEAVDHNQLVWRKHQAYAWNSPEVNTDGTYKNFVGYNWLSATQHPHWLKLGEVVQYDHYSKTLMTQDVNGNFTGQKMGYHQSQVIVSASNARYTEIAYSGAEDKLAAGSGFHFGGEVTGGENQSTDVKHTGLYSLKLGGGASGFQYRAAIGSEVEPGRTYHASVWVHKNDFAAKNGKLYAEAAPAAGTPTLIKEISLADASAKQAGDWYLLDLYFDLPSTYNNQMLSLGCRNAGAAGSAAVYFDDFRFHPVDAPITTYVYDPHTWQVNYVLDGDNIYTRYEYDASGRLTRTYQETLGNGKAEKLMRENSYYYARRIH